MNKSNLKKSPVISFLFAIIIIEIVVGGSGRLIDIGPVSLKMILFILGMLAFILSIKKLGKNIISTLQLFLTICLLLGISIGLLNGAELSLLFEDVKPLIFFYLISYFYISIQDVQDFLKLINYIKYGALAMSIIHLFVVILLYLHIMDFSRFYEQQSEGSEIMFRNEVLFFYKGFLYLCIGFFFLLLSNKKIDRLLSILPFISICLTLTRGFIFSTLLVLFFYMLFINKQIKIKIIAVLTATAAIIYALPILMDARSDNSSESDLIRKIIFDEVLNDINPFSFLFGHGFGHGVPIRPVHMEISFLEIFHKQGIFGLLFYLAIIVIVIVYYKNIKNENFKRMSLPFLLSVIFVYLQSLTNPYVNNPIGISIICITLVFLYRTNTLEKKMI